jgi:hypothetical protein
MNKQRPDAARSGPAGKGPLLPSSGGDVIAAGNTWVGVSQAGYPFREELPIFLLIFLLPSIVAVLVKWKFL